MRKHYRLTGGRSRRLLCVAAALAASGSHAMEFDTGTPDLALRWDNTLKYSAAWRLKNQSPGLISAPNVDDGDRNFDKGLISNRIDLLSELDLVYAKRYGFRLSGAGWYDQVYNEKNDNPGFPGGAFPNQQSVAYNEFTGATRRLHGRKTDLLDAFVFGGVDIADSRLNVRLGQHSVIWGESLFFGANAIAGAMAPVDVIKLVSVPGTQFKEAIRPVPQISAQLQVSRTVSLGAFYQFKWEANRLPAVGSYFSGIDTLPEGGEFLISGPGTAARRLADQSPRNRGQGGIQLRVQGEETDFGLYLVRFHSKSAQQVVNLGLGPTGPFPESYRLAYNQGIVALGASASRTFGDMQVAIEGSLRRNQDLASSHATDASQLFGAPLSTDNNGNPAYATGKTAHVNISTIWTLPKTPLASEATFTGEIMWNRVLSVTKGASALDPNSTRDAVALRFILEPSYRQVLPGLDLSVPIGLGYSPKGSRSQALGPGLPAENGGDLTIGLNGSYLDAWRFGLSYTHHYGSEGTLLVGNPPSFSYQQHLRDRDFIAFSMRHTF